MKLSREPMALAILWVAAALFVALAVAGGIRNYTIVPHWDSWHGYLHFYVRASEGNWREWWAQHNEHRIVLARLLFWMDLHWFKGGAWFLILVNYLLVASAWLTFRGFVRAWQGPPRAALAANLFILACLFSWLQWENLTWAFQSQFFLAQSLPLLALYLLYRSSLPSPEAARDFRLAALAGVLCIGTMASGVMALPIMVVYAAVTRMGWKKTAVLAALSVACLAVYFAGYKSTPGHGSVSDTFRHNPVELAQYVLVYLGTPFYRIIGIDSLPLAQAFGLAFVLLAGAKAVQCLRSPRQHVLALALLAYIAYIGGTATGTGAGRVLLGIGQATASRYTTPTLMGWMALLVLYLPWLGANLGRHRVFWPMLALLAALLVPQLKAARSERPLLFEREVAALSLELGTFDEEQVNFVYFNTGWALALTRQASQDNLSVFGLPKIQDAGLLIGQPLARLPPPDCRAAILESGDLPRDPRFKRIYGWIAPAAGRNGMEAVGLVDAKGTIVGYALVGRPLDVPQAQGGQARRFKGYLLASAFDSPLHVVPKSSECSAAVPPVPRPAFRLEYPDMATAPPGAGTHALVSNQGWSGSDSHRSKLPGFAVLGSYIAGDADTGTVKLKLKRGDRLFYRSGPTVRNQLFQVDDGRLFKGTLPNASGWSALVLDNPLLPDEFTLTLTDTGTSWGEWSAIALKEQP